MLDIDAAVELWRLSEVCAIADTPGSRVFRARRADGRSVVAKILKPRGLGEMAGMDYLAWRGGDGAVALLERRENACLLEDAGNRSLEDVRRLSGEAAAADIFAALLTRLHTPSPHPAPDTLIPLERHFEALVDRQPMVPDAHRGDVTWAASIARDLLAAQTEVMPLHGDLHHENILADETGEWRAIDPHGLIGDPVYDAANFFGNPLGQPDVTCDAARIDLLATRLAAALGCDRRKLLRHAATHAALSACWSISDPVSNGDISDAGDRLAFLRIVRTMLG